MNALRKIMPIFRMTVAIAIVFWLFGRLVAQPYVIPSPSMAPTLVPGDHVVALKFAYGVRIPFVDKVLWETTPEKGDIVVFRYPGNPGITFVKRIVADAGDTVEVRKGKLLVNGKGSPWQGTLSGDKDAPGRDYPEAVVPEGHLFAMGDNRDRSTDSRFWGFLPARDVLGKVSFIYWSSGNGEIPSWGRTGMAVR